MGLGYYWLNRLSSIDLFLIYVWNKLPDQEDINTRRGRMGSKFELLLFIGLFMIFFIQFFERHPNYIIPQRFNKSNAQQFYLQVEN